MGSRVEHNYFLCLTLVLSAYAIVTEAFVTTAAVNPTGRIVTTIFGNIPPPCFTTSRGTPGSLSFNDEHKVIVRTAPLFALLWEDDEKPDKNVMLAERISLDDEKTCKLARLAVAFSPPEQRLTMKHLDSVHVVCVDEQHIEISAMMCEEECVSVLIPLTFPHSCESDDGDMEECVLENVDEMDAVAEVKISKMSERSEGFTEGCSQNDYDDMNLCASNKPYDFPTWWVQPNDQQLGLNVADSMDLYKECQSIVRLLNEEDFQEDMISLAAKGLYDSLGADGCDYQMQKAVVAAVGPVGLCLRAKAKKANEKGFSVIEIPIPFGKEPATDQNRLRALVLGAVAAVHVD